MPENNEIKDSLGKTIDDLFSDTPGAPVSPKAVKAPAPKAVSPKAEAPKAEASKAEAPKAEAPKAAAPKAAAPKAVAPKSVAPKVAAPKAEAPKTALTVSELKKLINAPREPRPVEKTPAWAMILTVCALILSLSIAGIAVVAAYFYFGPGAAAAEGNVLIAYAAMVMCIIVCGIFIGFVMGCAFLLRKIEKDIREIKSRL